jgi:hypothetical protein
MLLKFHRKLDDKGDEIYEEMKVLHEIRKVMTEAGAKEGDTIAAELKRLSNKIAGYDRAIRVLEGKGALTEKQQESLAFMRAPATAERKRRIDEAIRVLDEVAQGDTARLNLLQSFVPTAGFHKVNKEQYDSPEKVVDLLERWGPFYTGGTVVASQRNRQETTQRLGTTQIVSVSEFNATGAHAIVVVGANENTVYYKDPQKTDQVRSMDMRAFHAGLDVDASDFLIAINCDDGWDAEVAQCTHMKNGTAAIAG